MRKKIILLLAALVLSSRSYSEYVVVDTETGVRVPATYDGAAAGGGGGTAIYRADIQSTSVDWEAVSGLRLREYKITFENTKPAGSVGWEMYYLDGFPCYGYAQYVRTWVSAADKSGFVRANCLRRPKEIRLAYRAARKDDWQGRATGIMTCPVEKNLSVRLDRCGRQTWAEFEKDE